VTLVKASLSITPPSPEQSDHQSHQNKEKNTQLFLWYLLVRVKKIIWLFSVLDRIKNNTLLKHGE